MAKEISNNETKWNIVTIQLHTMEQEKWMATAALYMSMDRLTTVNQLKIEQKLASSLNDMQLKWSLHYHATNVTTLMSNKMHNAHFKLILEYCAI